MSSENSKNSKRQPRIIRASSLSSSAHRAVSENVSIDARGELRIRTKKIDFEERKKEQRAARRRYWFIRIGIGIVSFSLVSFILWALIFSPWFKIRSQAVRISGVNKWVSVTTIEKYTNPLIDRSLITILESQLEQQLDNIPGIAAAKVTKEYPHGLIVKLTEETPTALLYTEDKKNYVPVDSQARRLRTVKQAEVGIPIINVPTVKSGLRNETVQQSIKVLAALDKDLRSHITSTEAKTQDSITTVLDSGYTVVWGNASSMSTKQKIVTAIIAQLQAEGTATGTIDVSAPSRPIVK